MELTAWRTYLAVCRLGSLSAAALELGYTQSAISRQIASLERELGVSLLDRHARGVRATAVGEVFAVHAAAAIAEVDRAVQAATQGDARPLTIGATPSLAAGIVPAAIRRVIDDGQALTWALLPALSPELRDRVIAGRLDLAVVTDAPPGLQPDRRLDQRLLGIDEMVVVLPADHPQAGSGPVGIDALAEEVWVEDDDGSAALLRQHADRAGVTVHLDLVAADLPGKIALVATGHAIALIPGVMRGALRSDVATARLVDPPTRGVYAITPVKDPHPAARLIIGQLEGSVGLTGRRTG